MMPIRSISINKEDIVNLKRESLRPTNMQDFLTALKQVYCEWIWICIFTLEIG